MNKQDLEFWIVTPDCSQEYMLRATEAGAKQLVEEQGGGTYRPATGDDHMKFTSSMC